MALVRLFIQLLSDPAPLKNSFLGREERDLSVVLCGIRIIFLLSSGWEVLGRVLSSQ